MNVIEADLTTSNLNIGHFNVLKGALKLGENVKIGNNCHLEGNIEIGDGTILHDNISIINNVKIGKENTIYPGCKMGYDAQHLTQVNLLEKFVVIGDKNIFREGATVHQPYAGNKTIVGNNNFIMTYVNIPHDAIIGNRCVISYFCALGGHVSVGDYANIGLNASVHQFTKIAPYSFVGMGTTVTKCTLPFSLLYGNKKIHVKINKIGFERNYKGPITYEDITEAYKNLSQSNTLANSTIPELSNLMNTYIQDPRGYYI